MSVPVADPQARTSPIPASVDAVIVGAGHEFGVGLPVAMRRRPHRLRLGTDEPESAIALELAAMA